MSSERRDGAREFEPGEIVELPSELCEIGDEYLAISDQIKQLEARRAEISEALVTGIGEAEYGDGGAWTAKPCQSFAKRYLVVSEYYERDLLAAHIPYDERGGKWSRVSVRLTRVKPDVTRQ